jgi:hypothetical protein
MPETTFPRVLLIAHDATTNALMNGNPCVHLSPESIAIYGCGECRSSDIGALVSTIAPHEVRKQ